MHNSSPILKISAILAILLLAGCSSPLIINISIPTATSISPTTPVKPTSPPKPHATQTHAPTPTAAKSGDTPTAQPTSAQPMTISIDPFPNGSSFPGPVTITLTGSANPVPFEKQMTYQVYTTKKELIDQGTVMVSGEYGQAGTFNVPVAFKEGQTGDFTIRILDASPKDGSILASAETTVQIQGSAPAHMVIQIDPFPNGSTFKSPGPVHLTGKVNITPFEKQMGYQIMSPDGQVVDSGQVMVTGEYGASGVFQVDVPFPAGSAGDFTIRVFTASPKDGSVLASADIKVTLN